ncbi:DUF6768 family protein [Allomuricauda sp. SCSIO 65647]|uniref:DUF6768 family protein n=1 Tax=Allomuricauda sp. SCSIO 65647 TaxID=2908843 RepID=UPI001F1DA65F|nr:DUF6768 family protein [Muricauda sp. SCSIO 65647]UJH67947.1 hypothetical protein L0P89_01700 [Muricauda sp. SCSIO 65647]
MKKKTEKIDELIKETLSKEEAAFYDELEEKNLFGKIEEVYRGKMGWLAIMMNVVHLIVFGVFVYCLVQFFDAEETKDLIVWLGAGFLCLIMMGMLKLYVWMQMDKNDILRELKRLELQVSVLAGTKSGSDDHE